MEIPTPANEDLMAPEVIFKHLLSAACGEDLDAPQPSHEEVVEQALRDIAVERALWREWRQANRPRLVVDNAPAADPGAAAFLAARAAVAARRRDLAAGIAARGDEDGRP